MVVLETSSQCNGRREKEKIKKGRGERTATAEKELEITQTGIVPNSPGASSIRGNPSKSSCRFEMQLMEVSPLPYPPLPVGA